MAVIYLCPADKRLSCSWEGHANEIKQHFEKDHTELLFHTASIQIKLDELPENKLLYLEGESYLMQNYMKDGKLCVKLRYLGSNATASKIQYDLLITAKGIIYKYEPSRYFSCVVPKAGEWEINLDCLEKYHGTLETLTCTVILEDLVHIERKISDTFLKINNSFVEEYVCDETEANLWEAINMAENRIEVLKSEVQHVEKRDYYKQISLESTLEELKHDSLMLEQHVQQGNDYHTSSGSEQNQNRESGDFMDKVSQLDFSILEEPFAKTSENESSTEILPNIPEELNLHCSSCYLDMLPPIYICTEGHNVCNSCKSKPCAICNATITITRNTELENISRTHQHLCRYASEGCNERLLYNELRAHEAKCSFCKYKCKSDNCPFEGKFDQFSNHLKIVHSSVKVGLTTRNDFPKNFELYVVNKAVGIFYCKSEVSNDFLIWRATFCGPSERQFFCELAFKGSKYKEPIFLKRKGNIYEIRKPLAELKKYKAKEKYAQLTITSYDS